MRTELRSRVSQAVWETCSLHSTSILFLIPFRDETKPCFLTPALFSPEGLLCFCSCHRFSLWLEVGRVQEGKKNKNKKLMSSISTNQSEFHNIWFSVCVWQLGLQSLLLPWQSTSVSLFECFVFCFLEWHRKKEAKDRWRVKNGARQWHWISLWTQARKYQARAFLLSVLKCVPALWWNNLIPPCYCRCWRILIYVAPVLSI